MRPPNRLDDPDRSSTASPTRKHPPSLIEGPYLQDILDQPSALRATVDGLRQADHSGLERLLRTNRARRIVLTGMGSSFHALHPLTLRLISAGQPALMVETSELIHSQRKLIGPDSLLVMVSQSGRSAETVRLLRMAGTRAATIGVTNTPESPLARRTSAIVPTAAGAEHSVSCKTYLATLVALDWLGDRLLGRDDRRLARVMTATDQIETYLGSCRRHVATLQRRLDGVRHLFLLGRGASLAAAGTGGLTIKESAHFHAEAMSAGAFRHGPFEMTGPDVALLAFEGTGKAAELAVRLGRDVRKLGARFFLIGPSGRGPFRLPRHTREVAPLLEMLPVQMVTLALAALAGREAGRFDIATKVTATE